MIEKCVIEKHIGKIGELDYQGFQKEINLVSWFNKKPKFDIRGWSEDHKKMTKGISLTEEEMNGLIGLMQVFNEN